MCAVSTCTRHVYLHESTLLNEQYLIANVSLIPILGVCPACIYILRFQLR